VDGGDNWSASNNNMTNGDIRALAIDRANPSTLYAGATNGDVFKSTDGGDHWNTVNTGLINPQQVRALVFDPTTPGRLFAGTFGGIFVTTNGGDNWSAAGLVNYCSFAKIGD
jgi:photosystem II stability/assembly factor-like uncharacterized protein